MDPTFAALLGALVGLLLGGGAVALLTRRRQHPPRRPAPASDTGLPGLVDLLGVLRSIGILIDPDDRVVNHSASAVSQGLVRHGDLVHEELRRLVSHVRADGEVRETALELRRGPAGTSLLHVRVAPLGRDYVALLAEDQTQSRRVEEVRRDFIANVSHELKTPVGGILLLAEAVLDAKDDPEAVARFAQRIQVESTRLTQLVKEIVDLSRLQVADALEDPRLVSMAGVIAEAVDRISVSAHAKEISLVRVVEPGVHVYGDHDLLVTAVANLLTNAVNYSDEHTRVTVAGRTSGDTVTITVTDQGRGIPASEQSRIFERFYRVDTARSRATGGTGLGLAIVKHVCANHGGEVSVWSEEGHGSTFTITLPAAVDRGPGVGPGVEAVVEDGRSGSADPGERGAHGERGRHSQAPAGATPRHTTSPTGTHPASQRASTTARTAHHGDDPGALSAQGGQRA